MMNTSQIAISSKNKIIFFGTGPVAAASLDFLTDHFEIEAVITKPRAYGHKGSVPVEELCKIQGLSTYFVANKRELDELIAQRIFLSNVGVVVDFGIIISQRVIDSFEKGIINSHFSLLPEWRGADPISHTILSGQAKTGVSLMVIEPTLDTGKLITQRSLLVAPKDTTGSLTEKLIHFSNRLILEYLPQYLDGKITPKNQPHPERATYSHKLTKADGFIDWNESAETIERKIRAYQPWPRVRAKLGPLECILLAADVIPSQEQPIGTITNGMSNDHSSYLYVECGRDALSITMLQPLGKKEMPIQAFLSGYKSHIIRNP